MLHVPAFMVFNRQMWRMEADKAELEIKVDEIKIELPQKGYDGSIEQYMITMNRNFTEATDTSNVKLRLIKLIKNG